MSKPKLCKILGVEVDERFVIRNHKNQDYVDQDGVLFAVDDDGTIHAEESSVLCEIVEDPDLIIRKQNKWTKKDIADAKAVVQLWGKYASIVTRTGPYVHVQSFFGYTSVIFYNKDLFPSLKEGQKGYISDILEEDTDGQTEDL